MVGRLLYLRLEPGCVTANVHVLNEHNCAMRFVPCSQHVRTGNSLKAKSFGVRPFPCSWTGRSSQSRFFQSDMCQVSNFRQMRMTDSEWVNSSRLLLSCDCKIWRSLRRKASRSRPSAAWTFSGRCQLIANPGSCLPAIAILCGA